MYFDVEFWKNSGRHFSFVITVVPVFLLFKSILLFILFFFFAQLHPVFLIYSNENQIIGTPQVINTIPANQYSYYTLYWSHYYFSLQIEQIRWSYTTLPNTVYVMYWKVPNWMSLLMADRVIHCVMLFFSFCSYKPFTVLQFSNVWTF